MQIKVDLILIFRRLQLLLTTYLATVTITLLLTGTIRIAKNKNILTEHTRGNIWRRNTMNYNNSNCRFIFAFTDTSIYKIACSFPVYNLINTIKANYYIVNKSYFIQKQSHITVYTNKYWISIKVQFSIFLLVKLIIVANTFHIGSDKPMDIICR